MRLKAISSAGLFSIAVCFALTALVRPMQAQERMVEWPAHPLVKLDQSASTTRLANVKEAVEIVEVKVGDAAITIGRSFLAGDDWLRRLCFRVKNVSGRPIIGARLSFSLPETMVDNNGLGFSFEYGRGLSTGIPSSEQKVVMPDEEFELKFNDRQYQRHRQFVTDRSKRNSFSKIIIGTIVVKFEDESIWVGRMSTRRRSHELMSRASGITLRLHGTRHERPLSLLAWASRSSANVRRLGLYS